MSERKDLREQAFGGCAELQAANYIKIAKIISKQQKDNNADLYMEV